MKNPLHKRILRLFLKKPGSYLPLFFISLITVVFTSSFFIAQNSIKPLYYRQLKEHKVEDGQFTLTHALTKDAFQSVEALGLTLEEQFYKEAAFSLPHDTSKEEKTLRLFKNRRTINTVSLNDGRMPEKDNEVAVAANFGRISKLKCGDTLFIDHRPFTVTGFVSTPDYSTILKNPGDLVMDTAHFSIAFLTDDAFDSMRGHAHCLYAYRNKRKLTEEDNRHRLETILAKAAHTSPILSATTADDNRCIQYFIDDMGGDVPMMFSLMAILFLSLAFLSALQTKSLIQEEAPVIGTLLASGFTTRTMRLHYSCIPLLFTCLAGILGNALAYTWVYKIYADIYYTSYNLPAFVPIFSAKSFLMTTLVPLGIVYGVNQLLLAHYFRLTPLAFLRKEFKKKKHRKAPALANLSFPRAFQLRVLMEHRLNILALFFGVFIGNILLMYGISMKPMFEDYTKDVQKEMKYNYTYLVKAPAADSALATKARLMDVDYKPDKKGEKEKVAIPLMGIEANSRYRADVLDTLADDEILISKGMAKRYRLHTGDVLSMKAPQEKTYRTLHILGLMNDIHSIQAFMPLASLNRLSGNPNNSFNAYLSDRKMTIDDTLLINTINREKTGDYLNHFLDSFQGVFQSVALVAVAFYFTLIHTVSKLILEKSERDIAYLKIFGFTDGELTRFYLKSIGIALALFYPLTFPLFRYAMRKLFTASLSKLSIYIEPTFPIQSYLILSLVGIALFLLAQALGRRKIKKLHMTEELKNVSG